MAFTAEGVPCCGVGFRHSVVLLAAVMCLAPSGRASLITINPTFAPSITGDPNAAAIESTINAAINYYDTTFTTGFSPLSVNITFQETTSGLGASSTSAFTVSYSSFITQLHAASSGDATDIAALSNLPIAATNPVTGSRSILVTSADCRALGLACNPIGPSGAPAPDSTIFLNTSLTSPPNGLGPNTYSLLAVTEHEIDEALGLGSTANSVGPAPTNPLPEDLFRYGLNGARVYNTPAGFDGAYFSLDGKTFLVQFNNLPNGGDQGDWWSSTPGKYPPRVQDGFGTPGVNLTLATDAGTPEIIALDAIGYNLNHLATPEPTTLLMVGSGLLVAALLSRRQARSTSQPPPDGCGSVKQD